MSLKRLAWQMPLQHKNLLGPRFSTEKSTKVKDLMMYDFAHALQRKQSNFEPILGFQRAYFLHACQ